MPQSNVQTDRVRLSDGAELATWSTWRTTGVAVLLVHGGPGLWDYLGPLEDLIDDAGAVAYVNGVGIGDWRAVSRVEEARRRRDCGFDERLAQLSGRSRTPVEEVEWRQLKWATDYADTAAGLAAARAMAEMPLEINHIANRALGFSDADVVGWAARTACPVFFLHGIADHRPVSHITALAAKTPNARKRVIEGAGHLPWVERPGEVRELLGEVIRAAG